MRAVFIAVAVVVALLAAVPAVLAGHGGGELLRAESAADR